MSRVFDPAKAARLDDPERLRYLDVATVERWLDAPPNALVVDYGTGTGFFAFGLARARPDLTIVALDRQFEMLDMLRAKPDAATFGQRVVPLHSSEFAAYHGRADRVLAINVLHELDDEHVAQIRAALRPDGHAVVIDWDASVDRDVGPDGDHIFDAPRAKTYLAERGFESIGELHARYQFGLRARVSRAATSAV